MVRPAWQRGCLVFFTTCLLGMLVACPLGVAGIWQGIVKPPWFDYMLGPVRLIGYSNWNVDCPPYTGCNPTRQEAYVVWVAFSALHTPANARAYRLVAVPIHPAFESQ
ncbi:MAG TPA: hypothetical protein VFT66_24265 [Roseiflexaceae bacterium]|nr:hypothetical protein [Roseiflexaceae bacterium]